MLAHLPASDMDGARQLYRELEALAQAHPAESEIRRHHGMAAHNLIIHLLASDMEGACRVYRELEALAQAHPDEKEIRLFQARAAHNLITELSDELDCFFEIQYSHCGWPS